MTVTSRALSEGMELAGASGRKYLLVGALGARPGLAPNVWTAVDADTHSEIFIVKQPNAYDAYGWPEFKQEMVMHELFKDCDHIRRQVDKIAPGSVSPLPAVVLEAFEGTVWSARASRPFTSNELKSVMKSSLLGLGEIHAKGMVYADLKMENIVLNGFRVKPEDGDSKLVAKISDLGTVMYPGTGKAQPISYRSPEVHFKSVITPAADIWSWGVIYCHLLEAQASHTEGGMYDTEYKGTMTESERAVRRAIQNDFDISKVAYYKDVYVPSRDSDYDEEEQLFSRLARKGVSENEIYFLKCVLNPDPTKRPTVDEILAFGWLDASDEGDGDKIPEQRHRPSASRGPSMLGQSPVSAAIATAYHSQPADSSGSARSRPPLKATNTGTFLSYVSMHSGSTSPVRTPAVPTPPAQATEAPSNTSKTTTLGETPALPVAPAHASNGGTYFSYLNGTAHGSNPAVSGVGAPANAGTSSMPDTAQPAAAPSARPSMAARKGTGTWLSYSSDSPFGAASPALSGANTPAHQTPAQPGGGLAANKSPDAGTTDTAPFEPSKRSLAAHVEEADEGEGEGGAKVRTKMSRTHT